MLRRIIKRLVFRIRGEDLLEDLIKRGLTVGENFKKLHGCILDPGHCWLIKIGNNVTMAPRVHVLAHDASTKTFLGYTKIGRVNIGNNVFIGAESIILPNITIGDRVIIGAGSVVTRNLEPNAVYAGNPAKYICSIDDYLDKNRKKMDVYPIYTSEYTIRKNIDDLKKNQMKKELENNIGYVE